MTTTGTSFQSQQPSPGLATCRYCSKIISQDEIGAWFHTLPSDDAPWHCDAHDSPLRFAQVHHPIDCDHPACN